MTDTHGWRSDWVTGSTGIALTAAPPPGDGAHVDAGGPDITGLVGLALRDNPRRAFLLVSRVLGKHVPVVPAEAMAAADALAGAVTDRLGGAAPSLVLGFAETATGLGHAVAVTLGAPYLHSTRRPADAPVALAFDEAHSHARGHVVCPDDPGMLTGDGPVVLVDDELSTGRTALHTVAALQAVHPRRQYLVAALVDVRSEADERRLAADALGLGVDVAWVALARGELYVPADAAARATRARAAVGSPAPVAPGDWPVAPNPPPPGHVIRFTARWPAGVREGGRYGITAVGSGALDRAAAAVAAQLAAALLSAAAGGATAGDHAGTDRRVLVLGTEELLYAPMRIAAHLAAAGLAVWSSSTTRSPAVVVADEGYPLRDRVVFAAHDLPDGEREDRFAYNVTASPTGQPWSDIVVVVDSAGDTAQLYAHGGLLEELTAVGAAVWPLVLPVTR